MDFALFVALNAVLLIRPEELFPDLAGARLYLIVIGGCLLTTGPRLLAKLQWSELKARPVTVCVLGVWAAAILSQSAQGQIGLALDLGAEFGKVMLYYLLVISVLDTVGRFRAFLGWIVAFVIVITTLALLQYHGYIDLAALRPLERKVDGEEETFILQLRGTGIYNDPNDLCLLLVTGSVCALYRSTSANSLLERILWISPIILLGYAVTLTQSRGGVLGFGLAAVVWMYGRYGWVRTLLLTAALAPLASSVLGGRQADIGLGKDDTAHQRVGLWADGFLAMDRNPVTGIGMHRYAEEAGLVAHNSFVHAYVELGLLGGGLFLGAFYFGALGTYRVRPVWNPELERLRPFVLAIVLGYAGGAFSISRNYIVPTYLVLGLADSYLQLARPALPAWFQLDRRMIGALAGLAVAGLVGLKFLTQVLLVMG